MLTIEEIKQAVEFADGFNLKKEDDYFIVIWDSGEAQENASHFCNDFYYDLFLDRVLQGINRDKDTPIISQMWKSITWLDAFDGGEFPHNGTTEGIREAREKAIRFVLEEMK